MHEVPTYEKIMILKYYQVDFLVNKHHPDSCRSTYAYPQPQPDRTSFKISGHQLFPLQRLSPQKKKKVPSGSASGMKHGEEKEQQLATSDTSLN